MICQNRLYPAYRKLSVKFPTNQYIPTDTAYVVSIKRWQIIGCNRNQTEILATHPVFVRCIVVIIRGWRRLALNSTPIPQNFKLLRWCAEVKPKFAFFQKQREGFAINSVVFAQDAFCLIPKILNAVNVVLTICKFLGMVDTVMDKTAYVQLVIAAQAIRVNNTVRHDFLFDNRHQSIRLGIMYRHRPSAVLEAKPKRAAHRVRIRKP